jgi:hypothetical protein
LSLDEVKEHLRLESNEQDALLQTYIETARMACEHHTARVLMTQTWETRFDGFPGLVDESLDFDNEVLTLPRTATRTLRQSLAITLPKGPVQSIESIQYRDPRGAWQSLDADDYVRDHVIGIDRIYPGPAGWPAVDELSGSVCIRYVAGFGGRWATPSALRLWMLLRIGAMYEHREETSAKTLSRLPSMDRLLDPYKLMI